MPYAVRLKPRAERDLDRLPIQTTPNQNSPVRGFGRASCFLLIESRGGSSRSIPWDTPPGVGARLAVLRRAAFQQTGGLGEFRRLDAAGAAQLRQDVAHVAFGRLLADGQTLRDLAIGHAVHHQ
jgi:hypothetical protein